MHSRTHSIPQSPRRTMMIQKTPFTRVCSAERSTCGAQNNFLSCGEARTQTAQRRQHRKNKKEAQKRTTPKHTHTHTHAPTTATLTTTTTDKSALVSLPSNKTRTTRTRGHAAHEDKRTPKKNEKQNWHSAELSQRPSQNDSARAVGEPRRRKSQK